MLAETTKGNAMRTTRIAALGVVALMAGGFAATSVDGASAEHPSPAVDPSNFTHPLPNPYFPLVPGNVFHYRGSDDGEHLKETLTITRRTKVIEGVKTTVVSDILRRRDGSLAEKTTDWYAGDNAGNVWYFGEDTATYDEHGHLDSREGSWQAGVKGAVPGTIMPMNPQPTDAYRQEFFKGQAEDQAWIVQRNITMRVLLGRLHHVVRSLEWTRLEPGVVSVKFYAPGLGIVREMDLSGGTEKFDLARVTHF
jgi:hypothetical protein